MDVTQECRVLVVTSTVSLAYLIAAVIDLS